MPRRKKGLRYRSPGAHKIRGEWYYATSGHKTKAAARREGAYHKGRWGDNYRVVRTPKSVRVRKQHDQPWTLYTTVRKRR